MHFWMIRYNYIFKILCIWLMTFFGCLACGSLCQGWRE